MADAALRVFYERGYAESSTRDIADALGVLKGSLYHYIDTKEELLLRVLADVHLAVDEILRAVLAVANLEPLDRLALYVKRQVEYNIDNLQRSAVYYHELRHLGPDRRAEAIARWRPHREFVTAQILEAQRRGLADPASDIRVLTHSVFATMIWTHRWVCPSDHARRELIAAECAGYAIGGVTRGRIAPAVGSEER